MEQRNNEFLQRKKEYEEQERLRRKAEERRKFEERMAEFERERAAEHERLKKIEEEKIRERQKLREERSGYILPTGIYICVYIWDWGKDFIVQYVAFRSACKVCRLIPTKKGY